MPLPPRLDFVTLGARDLPALRAFYGRLGWAEAPGSTDDFACFVLGSVRLALHPLDRLGAEAAPGAAPPDPGVWNGVTLAVNVGSREEVDAVLATALAAGATLVAEPTDRDWGGRSAYVADPEGTRWELAWAPDLAARTAGDVLRAMVAAFDGDESVVVEDLVHRDYLDHQGLDDHRPIAGPDGFALVVRTARAAYAELSVRVVDLVEGSDRAVARIAWRGTRANGEMVDRETIDIVRVAEARAIEHWGAQS